MSTRQAERQPDRGIYPDRQWWIGGAIMFAIGAGSVGVWWFGQTFPALWPQLPGVLP